jgi:hypothetical protein
MPTETSTIGFRVTDAEREQLEAEAKEAGKNLAEYARSKVLSNTNDDPSNGHLEARLEKLEALIKHSIYITNQVYTGLFSIAEAEGKAGRFLSLEQLQAVFKNVRAQALGYAAVFPEHFEAVQAEIAAAAKKEKA